MNGNGKGRRKLLPSDTSMDDSVREHKNSEKWWEVLDEGSYPSSCDPRYDRSDSTPRNLDPKCSIRGSMSFMSQRTSSSGFSCSDFSVEAKDVSRIMPQRKRKAFFVSPRQYNVAIPNETAVTFERTFHRSSDPDASSFKIDSSLEDGSRNEHTENINPLLNRRPNRKVEHCGNNFSRVLSDMTQLVSHTSVSDTIYEQVEKNNTGVISDVATCDIFRTDNYEAPATATYCRQTVERNGATTTYVTISEVKERVQIQNRSCRVPRKNQNSSFEISQAVTDLSYGSDCMIVEHISSPKNRSISHFHGGSGKKEGKLKDCNGLDILIETQNSIESFSGAEVEDIGDVLNRSGPIEKRKSRHKREKSGSKSSLDVYTREFKEILSEEPYSCKKTTRLSPDEINHDINQTSSFSASESFEKSGKKKSGRKIRKRPQGEDFAKEQSAGTYDRRASDSFNENYEVDIPDYPYFTNKRKRGQMEPKMSINSAVFADAFDPESHSDSHCSTGRNSSANSGSSYTTEANSSKRSRKNLNFNKMNPGCGVQASGSDSMKLRDKYSGHRSTSFNSDSIEIPDSHGSLTFLRKRKSVLPISSNAFADVLKCEVVPDQPGFHDAEDAQNILAQRDDSIQSEAPDIVPIQCPVNAKEMESAAGREVSPKRDNSHSAREDNNQSLDEVVSLGVDEINRLTSRRKKKVKKFSLSVNSNEFSEVLESDIMSDASNSLSLSTSHQEDEKGRKMSQSKDKVQVRVNKKKRVTMDDGQSLDEISLLSDIDTSHASPLLGLKRKKKRHLHTDLNILIDGVSDHSQSIHSSDERYSSEKNSLVCIGENLKPSDWDGQTETMKEVGKNAEIMFDAAYSLTLSTSHREDNKEGKKMAGSMEDKMPLRKSKEKQVKHDESQSLDEISIVSDIDTTNVSPLLGLKIKKKNRLASSKARINEEVGNKEKLGEDVTSDSKSIKFSSSKSIMNVESESVIEDNSSVKQNVPIFRRNRGKKTVIPENTSVFAGALGSDLESDCSSLVNSHEAVEGMRKDSACELVEKCNGTAPLENKSHEEDIVAVIHKDDIRKSVASPTVRDNDAVGKQEELSEDASSDSKSIKLSFSKSTVNVESVSVSGDNSSGQQNGPFLRRNRGKKTVMPVNTSVFAGALGSDIESDCSNVVSSHEAVEGVRKDSSCELVEKSNGTAPMLDRMAMENEPLEGHSGTHSNEDDDEVRKQEKLVEDLTSDSKSMKMSYSKSTVNVESQSGSGDNSSDQLNAPFLRRNKGKKSVMPVNTSVFAGALGSDIESDCSNVVSSHEAVEGVRKDLSCELVEKSNGTAPMLDRMAMENEPHESRTVSNVNKDNCRKGGVSPTVAENDEVGKQGKLREDASSDSKFIKLSFSKSTVNVESQSVSVDNSSGQQNGPFLRRNRGKKSVMPVNTSVFAGVLGSDIESDCSNVVTSHEAVGVRKDSSHELVDKCNLSNNAPLLDRMAMENEPHDSRTLTHSDKDNCKKDGISPTVKENDEVGKQEKLVEDVTSDSKSIKLSFSKSTVNVESGSVSGDNSSGQQNGPFLRRNRGKKTVMPVNTSVFAGALGSDVESDCSNVMNSHETIEGVRKDSSRELVDKCNGNAPLQDRMATENEPHESHTVTHSNKDNCRKGGVSPTVIDNDEGGKQEKLVKDLTSDSKSIKLSNSKSTVNVESESVSGDNSSGQQNAPFLRRNRGKKTVMPVNTSVFAGALGSDVESDCSNIMNSHETIGVRKDSSRELVDKCNGNAPLQDRMATENEPHESHTVTHSNKDNCRKGGVSPTVIDNDEGGKQEKLVKDLTSDSKSIKLSNSKSTVNVESESVSGDNSSGQQNAPFLRRNRGKKTVMPVNTSVFAGALGSDVESDCSNVVSSHEAVEGMGKDSSRELVDKCNGNAPLLDRMAMENEPHESHTVTHSNKDNCRKGGVSPTVIDNDEGGKQEKLVEDLTSDSKSMKLSNSKSTVNVESQSVSVDNSSGQQNGPFLRRNRGKKTVMPVNTSVFAGALGSDVDSDCSNVVSSHEAVEGVRKDLSCELVEISNGTAPMLDRMAMENEPNERLTVSHSNKDNFRKGGVIPTVKDNDEVGKREKLSEDASSDSKSIKFSFSKSTVNVESESVGGGNSSDQQNGPFLRRNRGKKPVNTSVFAGVLGSIVEAHSSISTDASKVALGSSQDVVKNISIVQTALELDGIMKNEVSSKSHVDRVNSASLSCALGGVKPIPTEVEKNVISLPGENGAAIALVSKERVEKSESLIVGGNDESPPVDGKACTENPSLPIFQRIRRKRFPLPANSDVFAGVLGTDLESDSSIAASASESVVVENEDDSLLPEGVICNWKSDDGYFESTRGFIVTDTKSPFSRINKDFGDLSCILKETASEKKSLEVEDVDGGPKKDNQTPQSSPIQSKEASILINNELPVVSSVPGSSVIPDSVPSALLEKNKTVATPVVSVLPSTHKEIQSSEQLSTSEGVKCVRDPIATSTIAHLQQKGANSKGELLLQASEVVNLQKQVSTIKNVMSKTNQAIQPTPTMPSPQNKVLSSAEQPPLPQTSEEIQSPKQTFSENKVNIASEAVQPSFTVVSTEEKVDLSPIDEPLPKPNEDINLPKSASTIGNSRRDSTDTKAVQPSPVVSSPEKEVFPCEELLPKQPEVHLPKDSSKIRNLRRGGKTFTAIPVPIASKRARKGRVITGNEMPSQPHAKGTKLSSDSLSPVKIKLSDIDSKANIVSSVNPVLPSEREHPISLESDTTVKKTLPTSKSPPLVQGTSVIHGSPSIVSDNKLSPDNCAEDHQLLAAHDATFVKASSVFTKEKNCSNDVIFTIQDWESEPEVPILSSACSINNLTFIKSSSAFDHITSAISASGCGPVNKSVVPLEEMKSIMSSYEAIEDELAALSSISQEIVAVPQVFDKSEITDMVSEKLPNDDNSQPIISSPGIGTSVKDHSLLMVSLNSIKSNSLNEQVTQTSPSQLKMTFQVVSPACPVSQSNAQDVPPHQIIDQIPGESFVQIETEQQSKISHQAIEVSQVQEKPDDVIFVETFTEDKAASQISQKMLGKSILIINDMPTANAAVAGVPKAPDNASQPEIKMLEVSQSIEGDGGTDVVSIADAKAECLHPVLQEESNNSGLKCSPLQHAPKIIQEASMLGNNTLSEQEAKPMESERNQSNVDTETPEYEVTNNEKPEVILPTDSFPSAVTSAHLISHREITLNTHSLVNDNVDQLPQIEMNSGANSLMKYSIENKSEYLSTRIKIVENVSSVVGRLTSTNDPVRPRSSPSSKANFKYSSQTLDSELLMLSPLNLKLISSESSGVLTSSSAIISGQFTDTEFSGNPEVQTTSKCEDSMNLHRTQDLTAPQNSLNSGPISCSKNSKGSPRCDKSATDLNISTKDLTPTLNIQSSGLVFNAELSSKDSTASHIVPQACTSSMREALIDSMEANQFWITSHSEKSRMVTSCGEGSLTHPYEKLIANSTGSTPTPQVSGPIPSVGASGKPRSREESMPATRGSSLLYSVENISAKSHKIENLTLARARTLWFPSHDEKSDQSCSYRSKEESTESTPKGMREADNSNSSAAEDDVVKIVDNVLKKLDDACARQTRRELEQAESTFKRFAALLPSEVSPDKRRKLKSCARDQVPTSRKRQVPKEPAEKRRRLPAWCSKTLKKMLVEAMEEREMTYLAQEEFLFDFADIVKQVMKSKDPEEVKDGVISVQKLLFDLKIVWNLSDFFQFVRNYLPREFRCRSIPCSGWDDPLYATWVDASDLNKPLF